MVQTLSELTGGGGVNAHAAENSWMHRSCRCGVSLCADHPGEGLYSRPLQTLRALKCKQRPSQRGRSELQAASCLKNL